MDRSILPEVGRTGIDNELTFFFGAAFFLGAVFFLVTVVFFFGAAFFFAGPFFKTFFASAESL
jgi:hypothetical protein